MAEKITNDEVIKTGNMVPVPEKSIANITSDTSNEKQNKTEPHALLYWDMEST
jgi:hypothetical protein